MTRQPPNPDRENDPEGTDEFHPFDEELAQTRMAPPIPLADEARPRQASRKTGTKHKISVLGDFRLLGKVGSGGMGTVYRAWQISQSREVALKVLTKEMAGRPGFMERFQREARLMARLDHRHIIRCHAVGEAHGFHYLALEYAGGGSMQSWLDRLGRLELSDAMHVILACARGLGYAHEHNLVHRDVKPDNLLLTSKGIVKVADLGLARAPDEDISLTQTGVALGTPLYAAPEQLRDARRADARSDLYAVGAVLYHLLTGRPPFAGDNYLAVVEAKERGSFPPVRRRRPELPEVVDRILTRLLARVPEQRYQSCAELIEDLQWQQLDSPSLSFFHSGE